MTEPAEEPNATMVDGPWDGQTIHLSSETILESQLDPQVEGWTGVYVLQPMVAAWVWEPATT